jgi:hypothetical protein
MVLKLIFRYESNKEPFSRLFQIASVEYIDDIKVLQETVLNHIGRSLHEISQGGKFKIDLDEQQEFCLSFSGDESDIHGNAREHLCNAEIRLLWLAI